MSLGPKQETKTKTRPSTGVTIEIREVEKATGLYPIEYSSGRRFYMHVCVDALHRRYPVGLFSILRVRALQVAERHDDFPDYRKSAILQAFRVGINRPGRPVVCLE